MNGAPFTSKKRKRVDTPKIVTIDDLIEFAFNYDFELDYGFDTYRLDNILPSLIRLRDMHGMLTVKNTLVQQVLYFIQGYNTSEDFMHTVITGKPGSGKTELANILASIYAGVGFLEHGKVHSVRRADLIGMYIGHTTVQTRDHIARAFGGVLLIDEAYSIGKNDKNGFDKECLDEINRSLTEYRDKFACIVSGYSDALDSTFFAGNEGLAGRFPWQYHIEDHDFKAVSAIFAQQVGALGWTLTNDANEYFAKLVKKGDLAFENFGRDTSIFFMKCRVAYSQRMLGRECDHTLTIHDVESAVALYALKFKSGKKIKQSKPPEGMYM